MHIPLYQVDAFTATVFSGNPAAVCPLDAWLPDPVLQAIAEENRLSETAFFVPDGDGFELRWFTPAVEVDLCGHATLASGFVILHLLEPAREMVRFSTRRSGDLRVTKDGGLLALDLPAHASRPDPGPEELPDALGARPLEVFAVRDNWLAVYADEAAVRALEPDFRRLAAIARHGVIATAPGDDVDFVSRFFAPAVGVDEDPVTGSAHCALVPFWAQRLGRHTLRARQVSRRGGDLLCTLDGQRVRLGGEAVLYLEGRITVSSGLLE